MLIEDDLFAVPPQIWSKFAPSHFRYKNMILISYPYNVGSPFSRTVYLWFWETLVRPFCFLVYIRIPPVPDSLHIPTRNILILRIDLFVMKIKKHLHPLKKDEEFAVPPLLAVKAHLVLNEAFTQCLK